MNGWGPKSSLCPSKHRDTKLLGGISQDFGRDIPGAPEKFEKKTSVFDFGPSQRGRKSSWSSKDEPWLPNPPTPPEFCRAFGVLQEGSAEPFA